MKFRIEIRPTQHQYRAVVYRKSFFQWEVVTVRDGQTEEEAVERAQESARVYAEEKQREKRRKVLYYEVYGVNPD